VYTAWPGTAFLLFTPGKAKHLNAQGVAVHGKEADCDCADVGSGVSEACKQWVVTRLLMGVPTKTILASTLLGVAWYCSCCLCSCRSASMATAQQTRWAQHVSRCALLRCV
jgi:hypothetical protein